VITDGRYLLRAESNTMLWRYDTRWRRTKRVPFGNGLPFELYEGDGHALLVQHIEGSILASVVGASDPSTTLATANYDGKVWAFAGDKSAWTSVPEYVLLPPEGESTSASGLLRIADGALIDPLVDVVGVRTVTAVPKSRLVVLVGSGKVTVYDPNSGHAGYRFALANDAANPQVRFRKEGAELWINDVDTMLKIETRDWEVIEAAGPPSEAEIQAPIAQWVFADDESVACLLRPDENEVVIVDSSTLELVEAVSFKASPVDVVRRNDKLVAVTGSGDVMRARLSARLADL